jgi:hypothetical protein
MTVRIAKRQGRLGAFAQRLTLISLTAGALGAIAVPVRSAGIPFYQGNLVVSRSIYDNNPKNIKVGTILPPNCASTTAGCAGAATNDGTYPLVFNNVLVDPSFGVTSKIFLDQISL